MSLKINFYCDEKYKGLIPEPIPSYKHFPEWFSKLPLKEKKYDIENDDIRQLIRGNDNNIKKCFGIREFLSTGYIIPSWCEFVFREQEDESLYVNWIGNCCDQIDYHSHPEEQYFTMPNKPIYGHFGKIFTPWVIKTDPNVSCLITHPIWHNNKLFTSTTAIMHTDKSPLRIPWFFEWNYKIQTKMDFNNIDLKNQVIPREEPLVLIIPFYRKKFLSKINYVSKQTFDHMYISQRYLTHDTIASKCPYTKFRRTLGNLFT